MPQLNRYLIWTNIKIGGFLLDYDAYSPGEKVATQEELIRAIAQHQDIFSQERKRIAALFLNDSNPMTRLYHLVKQI